MSGIEPPPTSLTSGILVPGQSYMPGTNNTRRNTIVLGGAGETGLITPTNSDICNRWGITIPSAGSGVTRFRFRVRNSNAFGNTSQAGAIACTGFWIGTPNIGAENAWSGDFTVAPTQVVGPFTIDPGSTGAETVTPWISSFPLASNKFYGVSMGVTCPAVQLNYAKPLPALSWQGTGSAAAASGAIVPGTTPNLFASFLDVRMEYEFQGSNEIGLVIGASLDSGTMSAGIFTAGTPIGHMGPDNTWHQQAALRLGHHSMNSGVGGVGAVSSPSFSATNKIAWTRLFSPESNYTALAVTPDYAIINLCLNDVGALTVTLAQFQTAIENLITLLNGLGIFRIYMCTASPFFTSPILPQCSASGILNVVPANPITSLSVSSGIGLAGGNPIVGPGPGFGSPGPSNAWFTGFATATCYLGDPLNPIGGPYTVSASAGGSGAPVVLTITGAPAKPGGAVIGVPVLSGPEYIRQLLNQWIRGLAPGVQTILDFEVDAIFEGQYPMTVGKPQYYSNAGDAHPTNIGLYDAFASRFVNGLVGN